MSLELWMALLESANVDSIVKAEGAPILVQEAYKRKEGQKTESIRREGDLRGRSRPDRANTPKGGRGRKASVSSRQEIGDRYRNGPTHVAALGVGVSDLRVLVNDEREVVGPLGVNKVANEADSGLRALLHDCSHVQLNHCAN